MAVTTRASKPKRTSRKGKSEWRKHVDITDIEAALTDARMEERTGGRLHKKEDKELFVVDNDLEEIMAQQSEERPSLRSHQKLSQPLYIDRILSERTSIAAILRPNGSIEKKAGPSKKQMTRLLQQMRKKAEPAKKTPVVQEEALVAPWTPVEETGKAMENDWTPSLRPKKVKRPSSMGLKPATAALPQVEVTHPGLSYLPTYEDHQASLQIAHDEEVARIADITRQLQLASSIRTAPTTPHDEMILEEEEEEEEAKQKGNEEGKETTRVKTTRKTQRDINKAKKKAQERNVQARQALEQKKIKAIQNLAKIQEELASVSKAKFQTEKKAVHPGRLGHQRFAAEHAAFQLTDDLPENFREVVPSGNLFHDRFKSLQNGGQIEPRLPAKVRRRYRQKEVEIHSYKRFH